MTSNQIAYWNLMEQKRANRAAESVKKFSAEETHRSNLAQEAEKYRSNIAQEAETRRSNQARESENRRHNFTSEGVSAKLAALEESKLHESKRHNVATEANQAIGNTTGLIGKALSYLAG